MGLKVYVNGELHEKQDARISVYDHGLLYGDGVFEGIRAYNGRIFRCKEHIDRLFASARAIALTMPMSKQEVTEAIRYTLDANGLSDAYIRLVVTRGVGTLGLDPYKCRDPQVIIITDSIALYPPQYYENGLELVTVSTVRNHPNAINPRIKSLNYLNNILAKIECIQAGLTEAIMLNKEGYVAECTGDNIFVVKDGRLMTPPVHAGILEGITRQVVMELAGQAGMEALERDMTRFDLYVADECFLTGTAAEIIPVVRIDSRQVGDGRPGPVTLKLLEMFRSQTTNSAG
ncbi:MAG: branched-chain amino acid aminotransferase [Planctomycetes bacterium SM23_32]|nr:MAG: branched-chain amino acid aminotransferase [Planctomycetes bacterium SM23_32]